MVRYLDYDKFLKLISDCEATMNFRNVKESELSDLFKTFDSNNTCIKKQVGLSVPHSYNGTVKTTGEFGKLKKGDILLVIYNDKHYLSIIEEVLYNEV